jgi:FtsH-binding integral membrane protein
MFHTDTVAKTGLEYDEGLRKFMLGVYNSMTLALAISGLFALGVSMNQTAMQIIWQTPLKWVVMLAPLGMSLAFMFMADKMSLAMTRIYMFTFAAVMGISLSSIFMIFKLGSIVNVFFITASTFGVASIYGYTTKRDLTSMGSFLMMGVIGLIIAGLVNLFLQSSMMAFVVSCISVLIFTGLTAYDTQNLKNIYDELYDEEMEKAGVFGALSLYINFINIFISLLQIFGDKKE